MKIFRAAKFDFRFHRSFKPLIALAFLGAFLSVMFISELSTQNVSPEQMNLTVGDCCFDFFKGIAEASNGVLPLFWLTCTLVMMAANLSYTDNDMSCFGYQVIARCSKRGTWWFAKCLSLIMTCLIQLAVMYFAIAAVALIGGARLSFGLSLYKLPALESVSVFYYAAVLYICPVTAYIALNMLQLLFGLFYKPVYGFLTNAVLIVITLNIKTVFLAPNSIMLSRFYPFLDDGFNGYHALLVNLAYIAVLVLLGLYKISKFDFIVLTGSGGRDEN